MEENKEKKTITLSLSTGVALIVILMLSIIILAGVYFYEIQKIKKENIENTTANITNSITSENVVPEANTAKEETKTFNIGTYSRHFKIEEENREGLNEITFSKENVFTIRNNIDPEPFSLEGAYKFSEDGTEIICTALAGGNLELSNIKGSVIFKIIDDNTIEVKESTLKILLSVGERLALEKNDGKIELSKNNFKVGTYKYELPEYKDKSNDLREEMVQRILFKEDNAFIASYSALAFDGGYKVSDDGNIITCIAVSCTNENSAGRAVREAKGKVVFKVVDEKTLEVLEVYVTDKNKLQDDADIDFFIVGEKLTFEK